MLILDDIEFISLITYLVHRPSSIHQLQQGGLLQPILQFSSTRNALSWLGRCHLGGHRCKSDDDYSYVPGKNTIIRALHDGYLIFIQLLSQIIKLSYFPQIKVKHTSKIFHGQIYIPWVNWILMIGTICVTAAYSNVCSSAS